MKKHQSEQVPACRFLRPSLRKQLATLDVREKVQVEGVRVAGAKPGGLLRSRGLGLHKKERSYAFYLKGRLQSAV